jgi:hypothetical protein
MDGVRTAAGEGKSPERPRSESDVGSPLSMEELTQVTGGITAKMPPLYYGDVSYGDMRIQCKTPLVCS